METRELELSKLKISKYFNAIQIDNIMRIIEIKIKI